jgi:hypothetical protein
MSFQNITTLIHIAVLVLVPFGVSAQTPTDSVKTEKPKAAKTINYPHLYWGFSGGYNMLEIASDNANVLLSNTASPTGGLYFELRINKWLGIETGGNYLMYSGDASLVSNDYTTTQVGLIDTDGDTYNATYSASGVQESWEASYIEIPLAVKLQLMAGKWTFYLKPGVSYNLVASSSYSQTGTYSRSGYYPDYDITFDNLPSHGFYKNYKKESSGEPAFTDFINPFVGFGIVLPAKRGNLFMEARYYPGTVSMVEPGTGTLFEGPADLAPMSADYQFESITEESGNVTMSGFVFNLGFRF